MATGHRSYQPVHPCGNKLLQKKWDETYYDEHRRMVKTAKPLVDTQPPKKYAHITEKQKKQQLQKERQDEIERDDLTLLTKMRHIMNTTGRVEHRNTYYSKHQGLSLNQERRQRELERVAKENKAMLKRIQNVQPQYHVSDWIADWQRKEELTEMITAYPSEPPPRLKKPTRITSDDSAVELEDSQDSSAPQEPPQPQEAPSLTPEVKQPPGRSKLSRTTPNLAHEIGKTSSERQRLARTTPNLAQEIRKASSPQKERQSSASGARQSSPQRKVSVTLPNLQQDIKRASLEQKVKQKDMRKTFA